jgi:hypothetical protein
MSQTTTNVKPPNTTYSISTLQYKLHPACAAWPQMTDKEIDELAADIKANGLLEPIALNPAGELVDGRNRALACSLIGITPTTVIYKGDPYLYSLSKNKLRRHMSASQIAMIAATMVTRTVGGSGYNRPKKVIGLNSTITHKIPITTAADVAAATGISVVTIAAAKTVLRNGTKEEILAVKTGTAKVQAVATTIRARNNPNTTSKIKQAEAITEAVAETLKAQTGKIPDSKLLKKIAGVSNQVADKVLKKITVKEAVNTPAQTKFTKAQDHQVAARLKILEAEFAERVRLQVLEENKEYRETLKKLTREAGEKSVHYHELINNHNPIFKDAEYLLILSCLHPDNSASAEKRKAAFLTFSLKKLALTGKK